MPASRPTPSDDQPMPVGGAPADRGPAGPIPEANRPGHHPEVEQDKPTRRPRPGRALRARRQREADAASSPAPKTERFDLRFDRSMRLPARLAGVTPRTASVEVGADLVIRFGPWSLRTPVSNVSATEITGGYSWIKTAGPPHLSRADGGITFATTTTRGVCIRFRDPVPAALPVPLLRHEAATVTVADPEALVEALERARQEVH